MSNTWSGRSGGGAPNAPAIQSISTPTPRVSGITDTAGRAAVLRFHRMKIRDISPPISPASPLFPGDEAYSQKWTARIGPGCPVNLSAITMSPHIGAHADAPLHYADDAPPIGEVDLAPYLGPCRVVHAIGPARLIQISDLAHATKGMPPRVLVRTCEKAPTAWSAE